MKLILEQFFLGNVSKMNFIFFFHFRETTCSVAKNFEAHIFYHEDFNEVQLILQSLGQGFQRTHYAV